MPQHAKNHKHKNADSYKPQNVPKAFTVIHSASIITRLENGGMDMEKIDVLQNHSLQLGRYIPVKITMRKKARESP